MIKTDKKTVIGVSVLIAISITVVFGAESFMREIYRVFYREPALAKLPENVRPWANPIPFDETGYSAAVLPVTIFVLAILWAGAIILKIIRRKMTIVTVLIALLMIMPAASLMNDNLNIIDVLCIGDEIFMAQSDWVTNAEDVLDQTDLVFNKYNIDFRIRGWQVWNSSYSNYIYNRYQEAICESGLPIRETEYGWGLISGSPWENEGLTWYIDLLLIFSYYPSSTHRGLSIPYLNATIIDANHVYPDVMTHEIGHQLYLEDCQSGYDCIMHDPVTSDDFCAVCNGILMEHRDKWTTDTHMLDVMISGNGDIHIAHIPSDNDYCDALNPSEGEWRACYDSHVAIDHEEYAVGLESIRFTETQGILFMQGAWRSDEGHLLNLNKYPFISFWTKLESSFTGEMVISVQAGGDWAEREILVVNDGSWQEINVPAGSEHEDEWSQGGETMPDWENIRWVIWRWYGTTGNVWLDGFYYDIDYSKWYSGAGTYEVLRNDKVVISSEAGDGYTFNHWIIDGSQQEGTTVNLLMDQNHIVEAYFTEQDEGDGGGGGGGDYRICPDR